MKMLRYIDLEGREQDVDDINHLYELIQANRVGYDSLVWDEEQQRWVAARDHKFFRRIREIAAASPPPLQPWSSASVVSPAQQQPLSAPSSPQSARTETPQSPVYKSPLMQHRNRIPGGPVSEDQKSKSKWLKAIQTKEEALKTIKDASAVFFSIAVLQGVIGIWMATQFPESGFDIGETVIDVALYGGCAAWLRWGRSRTAAVILFVAATVSLATTIGAQLKIIQGGKNVVVALIVFWTAVKAIEASFKLRGRFKQAEATAEPQLS